MLLGWALEVETRGLQQRRRYYKNICCFGDVSNLVLALVTPDTKYAPFYIPINHVSLSLLSKLVQCAVVKSHD
jgi:hypothetical protein